MMPRAHRALFAVALIAGLAAPAGAGAGQARPGRQPRPEGQRITARDGDVIVVENNDRVRMVRRRPAMARVVVDDARRLVVVLADWLPSADGNVDQSWRFTLIDGRWPLDARWDGEVVVEDDETLPPGPGAGLTLETPAGVVQFVNAPASVAPASGAIAVLRYGQFTRGDGRMASFDVAEQQQLSANPPTGNRASFGPPGSAGSWGGAQARMEAGPASQPPGALRVGGNVAPPRKIHHVDPVMPDLARANRVQGIVVLEMTVATDGSVQNPRVLRSIPILDQAALDAVSQWRFEPPLLNGQPVPVIMTVTVAFHLQN